MLANLLIDVGQAAAARAELEKAVHLYPQDPEAYVRMAELDAADGRVTEAGLLYAKAIDLADMFSESPKRRRQVQFRAVGRRGGGGKSRAMERRRGTICKPWLGSNPTMPRCCSDWPRRCSSWEKSTMPGVRWKRPMRPTVNRFPPT